MHKPYEIERLKALHDSGLLQKDVDDVNPFDRFTRLASKLFDAPISLVTLLDENTQWFKSRTGIKKESVPTDQAFCRFTIQSEKVLVVPDVQQDDRFKDNPLVTGKPNIRFYAGAPLISKDGYGLGAMCIIDSKPREISEEEQELLKDMAHLVMLQADLMNAVGRVDAFSGLSNRKQFYEDLKQLKQEQSGEGYTAIVADIMGRKKFEEIAHTLGTTCTDVLIQNTTDILRKTLKDKVKIYQKDTTSYMFLLKKQSSHHVQDIIQAIEKAFAEPLYFNNIPILLKPAIGLYHFIMNEDTGPDVMRKALLAALSAREEMRSWSTYEAGIDERRSRAFKILSDLPQALKSEEHFYLVYQPKINLKDEAVFDVEALLRWDHPELGMISPAEFIPLIEKTAFSEPLTQKVLDMALRQSAMWQKAGLKSSVAVNVSARNLEEIDFTAKLKRALDVYKISPSCLELEFTESAFIRNTEQVLHQLGEIRQMGVEVAIDDFGSGYSNYAYFKKIPANILKLDRSLIHNICENKHDQMFVKMIISMVHKLGYEVVAEGVETAEEYEILKKWSCDKLQGYYICKPLMPNDVADWWETRNAV